MKNTIRQISAILVVCTLCVCLFAGCGPAQSDVDGETTIVPDATTITLDGDTPSTDSTGSQTVSSSGSATSAQNKTNTSTSASSTVSTTAAEISDIFVGGTLLSEFSVGTKSYTYYLPAGTTAAPQVTANKTGGTGEIQITQAANANGAAKVTLNGTTYTIQFSVRRSEADMLKNTYYQLKTAKKLNVAYFGGSVTDGYGSSTKENSWRSLTTKWLKSQYPTATITETNAGIGGTGSIYGAHRVIQDLKLTSATEKPDLVFIEFAYNDQEDVYVNATPDVYMESIIQTIYKYAPQADIVMVFITGFNQKDTEFNAKVAHKKIADAYKIPYIDVGARLWQELVVENGGVAPKYNASNKSSSDQVWLKYFNDSVHPTDAGYAKYAQYVQEFLTDVFAKKTAVPTGLEKSYTPSKTVTTLPVAPYIDNLKGLTPTNSNLTVSDVGYVTSSKSGSTFTFKFTGTDLKAWIYGQSTNEDQAGYIRVQVDGGKVEKVSLKGGNHKILPLASGLSSGEHTVKITLSATSTGSVKLDLRYFLISGDTQMRGITLVE